MLEIESVVLKLNSGRVKKNLPFTVVSEKVLGIDY